MFGHQNDQNNQNDEIKAMEHGVNAIVASDPAPEQPAPSFTPPNPPTNDGGGLGSPYSPYASPAPSHGLQGIVTPTPRDDAPKPSAPVFDTPTPISAPRDYSNDNNSSSDSSSSDDSTPAIEQPTLDTNSLLDIKQQALTQLSPLVGHLEQTPEEKFRTTMMMIQASDNQSLIQDAYDSAQQITDEKARAQALLDVINEINYFTQHHNNV
jgi:hypothetical protein